MTTPEAKKQLVFNEGIFNSFPVLETERLVLRAPLLTDAEEYYRIFSDARTLEFLGRDPFASVDEAQDRLRVWLSNYESKEGIRWVFAKKPTRNTWAAAVSGD